MRRQGLKQKIMKAKEKILKEATKRTLNINEGSPLHNAVMKAMEEYAQQQVKNCSISDAISSKNHLSKDEILSTGYWYEADYANLMEGYFWKHKSIEEDGYVFYMRRNKNDGFTTIEEQGKEHNKLFEGYIKNIEELNQIIHLCRLHEI